MGVYYYTNTKNMKTKSGRVERIADINDLVSYLTAKGTKPLLYDEIWKCYGFKKRPSHKSKLNSLLGKNFDLENNIIKEVLTMGLVDIINGIRKSKESRVTKLLITLGVIDQFLSMTKNVIIPDQLIESFLYTYENYRANSKTDLHALIVYKIKNKLNKRDFLKFLAGTEKLLALKANGDFLIKSDYITKIIENSYKYRKLNLMMTGDEYEKYSSLIKERILII